NGAAPVLARCSKRARRAPTAAPVPPALRARPPAAAADLSADPNAPGPGRPARTGRAWQRPHSPGPDERALVPRPGPPGLAAAGRPPTRARLDDLQTAFAPTRPGVVRRRFPSAARPYRGAVAAARLPPLPDGRAVRPTAALRDATPRASAPTASAVWPASPAA